MQATPKKRKVNDCTKKCFCNKKKYGKITTSITVFYDGKLEKFYKCPMGPFKNYVDKILTIFDYLPTSTWTFLP